MFTMCVIYTCIVLGPWGLVGNLVVFLFYPIMVSIKQAILKSQRVLLKIFISF